jgi:outer membrane protein TolC
VDRKIREISGDASLGVSDWRKETEGSREVPWAIKQAQESLREIEQRYQNQIASITQLVDAQVALSNAEVRRTAAQAELEIARAALEHATGRLRNVIEQ